MSLYFLVLESQLFEEEIRPALAVSWKRRDFGPCRALCARLLPMARDFADRYHLGSQEPLIASVAKGLTFDRIFWKHLVGEMLWFCAAEIPEIETSPDALGCLQARGQRWDLTTRRADLPPIMQAHHGSRDLVFGGGFYRPEHAGYSNVDDVARLAAYLGAIQPAAWQAQDLANVAPEEREEELAFLRDWFPPLQALYATAAQRGRIIACEFV